MWNILLKLKQGGYEERWQSLQLVRGSLPTLILKCLQQALSQVPQFEPVMVPRQAFALAGLVLWMATLLGAVCYTTLPRLSQPCSV